MKKVNLKMFCVLGVIILFNIAFAQMVIDTDTEWTTDQILTQSVIVQEGAKLIIHPGVKVQPLFIDTDADGAGDVGIIVNGKIKILGSVNNPVLFKPYENTTNRGYWQGITINSILLNDSMKHFEIYNSVVGLKINSEINVNAVKIFNTATNGILIDAIDLDIELNDVVIKNSNNAAVNINNSKNVTIRYAFIDSCNSFGVFNNSGVVTNIYNSIITNNTDAAIFNYHGTVNIYNSYIAENNRVGILCSSGDMVLKYTTINSNALGGILIGGFSDVDINYSTIQNNQCAAIELTEYSFGTSYPMSFESEGDPTFQIQNSNLVNNGRTPVEDPKIYQFWPQPEENFEFYGTVDIPLGNYLTFIEWKYGSIAGTYNYFFELEFTDYYFQNYNRQGQEYPPQNPNDNYNIWMKNPSPSGDCYLQEKIMLGKNEIFSNLNSSTTINASLNYWGQIFGVDTLVVSRVDGTIDYSGYKVTEIQGACNNLFENASLEITSPIAGNSYETAQMLNITWNKCGFTPLVNIEISEDLGNTWNNLANDLPNIGVFTWYNNLYKGTTVYIRIESAYDNSVYAQIGPFFIIENTTPSLNVSDFHLDFGSTTVSDTVLIINAGGGTLNWNAVPSHAWMTLSPTSGTAGNGKLKCT